MGPFTVGQIPSVPQVFNVTSDGLPKNLTAFTTINLITVGPDGEQIAASAMGTLGAVSTPTNQVTLSWNTSASPFVLPGAYRIQLELNGPGNVKDFSGVDIFLVEPEIDSVTSWATVNDVLTITGRLVTNEELIQSQMIIDNVTNRTPATSGQMQAQDLIWLKRAVAFQAVWMQAQPDLYTKMGTLGFDQDGAKATYKSKAANYLGPLAERALKNVSWLRSRSLRIETPFIDGQSPAGYNALIHDWYENWTTLGSLS